MESRNPIAVVKPIKAMTKEQRADLREALSQNASNMGIDFLIADEGIEIDIHQDIGAIAEAIEKQAKATAQLAEAVAILIAEMADPEQDGDHPSIPQSLSVRPTDG